jgi:hypothetical protein
MTALGGEGWQHERRDVAQILLSAAPGVVRALLAIGNQSGNLNARYSPE